MKKPLIVAMLLPFALSACDADGETIGTIAGAAAGAAAGKAIGGDGTSGTIGLIVGALAGGYLGNQVGKWLDNKDREKMSQSTSVAAENGKPGETYYWANPDSGNRGSVTANESFVSSGKSCRAVSQSVTTANGQSATGNGTVCKQADGTWQVVGG